MSAGSWWGSAPTCSSVFGLRSRPPRPPEAREGPTPVSAPTHAATMVAAGVYLVARPLPLFTPQSLQVVLAVGLVTHLAAGTVALTQTDIKRILAYSTVSQLGLMVTALGLGAAALSM